MKVAANRALVIYLVTPLVPVLGILVISGAWSVLIASPEIVSALCVLASALLFCSALRNRGTEFRGEGWSSLGVLAMLGSVVLYVLGSYYGALFAQWAALLALYDAILLYMGGTDLVSLAFLPTIALVPFALPSSGLLEDAFAVVLAGASAVSAVGLFRSHAGGRGPCPECDRYAARPQAYCPCCGRRLGTLMIPLNGRKIAKVGVLTVLLLVASASPIQVLVMQGGNPYLSTLRLSGLSIGPPITASSGWNVTSSDVKVNGSLSVASFELSKGGQTVAVTIATSSSKEAALRVTQGVYPNTRRNGTVSLGSSISAFLLFGTIGDNLTAINWNSNVDSYNGTSIQPLTVSYVAGENLTRAKINGSGLYSVATTSLLDLQGIQQWNWFPSVVGSNWYQNTTYIGMAGAVFLIALPFETARRTDADRARLLENTLGLSRQELEVLAIVSAKSPKTGEEILRSVPTESGYLYWPSLEAVLLKLEGLGLLHESIGRVRGESTLLWGSRI